MIRRWARYPSLANRLALNQRYAHGHLPPRARGRLATREKTLLFSIAAYTRVSHCKILMSLDSFSASPSSSDSSANRTFSNLLRKNARLDSRAGAAAKVEVGGAPALPDRIVDLAHLLLPRHGRFQASDRSALRPATSGCEGLSDGLLLHPHTIVLMLINDLADIDNEVFLFLDDYHSVTDPAIRGAASFLLRYAPSHWSLQRACSYAIAWLAKNR